jgi:pilus assembly protein Flp/PilA
LFVYASACEGNQPGAMVMVRRFFLDDKGSNALEYGLIVGLISLAIAAGATAAGTALGGIFNNLNNQISNIVVPS